MLAFVDPKPWHPLQHIQHCAHCTPATALVALHSLEKKADIDQHKKTIKNMHDREEASKEEAKSLKKQVEDSEQELAQKVLEFKEKHDRLERHEKHKTEKEKDKRKEADRKAEQERELRRNMQRQMQKEVEEHKTTLLDVESLKKHLKEKDFQLQMKENEKAAWDKRVKDLEGQKQECQQMLEQSVEEGKKLRETVQTAASQGGAEKTMSEAMKVAETNAAVDGAEMVLAKLRKEENDQMQEPPYKKLKQHVYAYQEAAADVLQECDKYIIRMKKVTEEALVAEKEHAETLKRLAEVQEHLAVNGMEMKTLKDRLAAKEEMLKQLGDGDNARERSEHRHASQKQKEPQMPT